MSFKTGIPALDGLRPWSGKQEFKLETPVALMAGLGDPQNKLKTIHVAGTNGKGSVCCYLAAILYSAGHKVGQMCSPHLSDVSERLMVDGRPVETSLLSRSAELALAKSKELGIDASFFEILTCLLYTSPSPRDRTRSRMPSSA